MVRYNNMFSPYYLPRTSVEEVDGVNIIVIWAPVGAIVSQTCTHRFAK